jgi:hypothetical protein
MADRYGHNRTTKKKKSWNVKESVIRPEEDARNRIDLKPDEFDRLIKQKGVIARVFRTTYCPNVKSVDGAEHEIDCTICNGSGFIDLDPICCHVFIQTQELDKLPNIEGFVDGNTVLITFPIGVEIQYFTKIELHDFTDIFPQRVLRKRGDLTDVLKYSACRVNLLIGKDGTRYYDGIDFRLDLNGNIRWQNPGDQQLATFSAAPTSGTFTLTYATLTTAPIASGASAAQVQAALRLLAGLEEITVSGDFATGFKTTFAGVDSPVGALTATSSLLDTDSDPVDITITNTTISARKPNDDQPYSIHYEAKTQYRARAAAHSNRFTQYTQGPAVEHIKMPEQWYFTKEFLVKRVDGLTGLELQQGPYDKKQVVEDDND